MKKIFIPILAVAVTLLLGGCGGSTGASHSEEQHDHSEHAEAEAHDHAHHSEEEEHAHADHPESEEHAHADAHGAEETTAVSDEITFPAAQAARTDFKVETIEPTEFHRVIACTGRILAATGDEAAVAAPISGIVSYNGKLALGSSVSRGRALFMISSKGLATGSQVDKITAAYRQAEAEYRRLEKLVDDRIVSRSDFETAESEYLKAKAEYDAVVGTSSEKGTGVVSPISGYVTSLSVGEGDYVEMGQPLAVVSQNRRLQLRVDLPQRYYRELRSVRSADMVDPATGESYSLSDMGGRLLSVGRLADEALVVPVTAITEAQGIYYVYVQLDEECYQRREVTLGARDGSSVQLLSGIEAGDRVVTRGAVSVKMAAASGAIPHSHSHNH